MIINGDQHVDEWAEAAVDYLDGRLGEQERAAVEAHLSGCSECAARLHTQHRVVSLLQEAVLADPPEDLEYRSIGEIIFPSPGTEPAILSVEDKKVYRSPRWFSTVRAWLPAGVAVVALLAAVVGYGIARSDQPANVASDTARSISTATAVAGTATTAAAMGDALSAAGAAEATMTTAGGATTTTAAAGTTLSAAPGSQTTKFAATQDPKAMARALLTAESPAFVSFRTASPDTPAGDLETLTTKASSGSAAVSATETTSAGASGESENATATETTAPAGVSDDAVSSLLAQITEFTGLEPVDRSLWLGGPTFAVYLPRKDATKLVDLVRSMSSSVGLQVSVEADPPAALRDRCDQLLADKTSFPVLKAHRAVQPATWGYDFTTSTLTRTSNGGQTDAAETPPADTHVIVVIFIAE